MTIAAYKNEPDFNTAWKGGVDPQLFFTEEFHFGQDDVKVTDGVKNADEGGKSEDGLFKSCIISKLTK